MNSTSSQFVPSRRMGLYEPVHEMVIWGDFNHKNLLDPSPFSMLEVDTNLDNQSEDTSHGTVGPSNRYDQETSKPDDKIRRRLAQNREAARKSRLRKKAYVQQLEKSKMRLIQGLSVSSGTDIGQLGGSIHPDIAAFEREYAQWIEEQNRQILQLKNALQSQTKDEELCRLVDCVMMHYTNLFAMKAKASKADAFYIMSGLWKTSAERFFLWIGGFRPSELLKVLWPHLEPLQEPQCMEISNLRQSCQQAEDALSQGMEKLHRILTETIAEGSLVETNYLHQIGATIDKLEALVRFVVQADHLRQETLQQISRILSPRQAARGLLALGDYMQRLRALSSCWSSRTRQQAA
ncbi:bZIP transcription factor family protein [Striga asiatica]|uniref:BZIP transcription factor family protein n=1 Tax=Striga asiatica TaxID=4170 RepID=A0A5A7PS80_STRAF|nr:bZIP transcription factor family protein [Striga asiatica]